MSNRNRHYILTLSCHDVAGIVATVSGFLRDHGGFILESAQFGDPSTGRFFMRCAFTLADEAISGDGFRERFAADVAAPFSMDWELTNTDRKPRVLIMVSKAGHCLNDLLHRWQSGTLPIEIPAVVSNHDAMRSLTEWHQIPYHHFPVTADTKAAQEQQILDLIECERIDVVVLARYMQVLSPTLVDALIGRAINIHHSFLPSFKGAKPYHQAYDRGVKLIGATAHYVSNELDEGPIIEQEVARVDHSHSPESLVAVGRDTESLALAKALRYHIERRVLLNGNKTVVFR